MVLCRKPKNLFVKWGSCSSESRRLSETTRKHTLIHCSLKVICLPLLLLAYPRSAIEVATTLGPGDKRRAIQPGMIPGQIPGLIPDAWSDITLTAGQIPPLAKLTAKQALRLLRDTGVGEKAVEYDTAPHRRSSHCRS